MSIEGSQFAKLFVHGKVDENQGDVRQVLQGHRLKLTTEDPGRSIHMALAGGSYKPGLYLGMGGTGEDRLGQS
jgi:hypothetical protein